MQLEYRLFSKPNTRAKRYEARNKIEKEKDLTLSGVETHTGISHAGV